MTLPALPWWAADFARPRRAARAGADPAAPADRPAPPEAADPGLPRGSVSVEPGAAVAEVSGRRFRTTTVRLTAPVLSRRRWEALFRLFAEQALYPAALLAGYLPRSARGDLSGRGVRLLPPANRVALAPAGLPEETRLEARQLIALHFAADPFHLLHFRGRDRAAVLAGICRGWRTRRAGPADENGAAIGLDELETILGNGVPAGPGPARGADDEGEAGAPSPPLRPLLLQVQQAEAFRGDPVLRAKLSRLYTKVTERAAALAPRHRAESPRKR